jgi:hypothetical protein
LIDARVTISRTLLLSSERVMPTFTSRSFDIWPSRGRRQCCSLPYPSGQAADVFGPGRILSKSASPQLEGLFRQAVERLLCRHDHDVLLSGTTRSDVPLAACSKEM